MALPVILTDIEGTTSSIDFVKDVLFPFARERLPGWLVAHADEPAVAAQVAATRHDAGLPADADLATVTAVLLRWIDEDRKATPLKALQGMVWADGYRGRDFVAHVYPDAADGLRRWHAAGHPLHVYSSGSVPAQRLFFAHSAAGDLTPLFSGYFDTTIGGKREADSYRRIAEAIGVPPGDILFLSDIEAELDAAADAGLRTVHLRRELDRDPPPGGRHRAVRSFDAIDPAVA